MKRASILVTLFGASLAIAISSNARAQTVLDTSAPSKDWFLEASVGVGQHRFLETSAWAKGVSIGAGGRSKNIAGLATFHFDVGETPYLVPTRTMAIGMAIEIPVRPVRLKLGGELTHMAFRRYARDEWVGKLGLGVRLGTAVDVVSFDDLALFVALDGHASWVGASSDLGAAGYLGVRF